MSLHANPEYERLLPKMSDDEFADLRASIEKEGQHYAIIVNENLEILDGHHRFRACVELGVEPDFEVRKFDDKLLEKKFVIEANLRRRHLNKFQLVELGVPLLEIEKALARKRLSEAGKKGRDIQLGLAPDDSMPERKGKATEAVAKRVGISTRTFERGKRILETASEEDKQKLREGKATISKIYRKVVIPEGKTQQSEPMRNMESDYPLTIANAVVELSEKSQRDPTLNNKLLLDVLKALLDEKLYCPSCGNAMFECSRCHKTLQELLHNSHPD
jgi:hypothetical protein